MVLYANGQVQFQQPFATPPHASPLHGQWYNIEHGYKIKFHWKGEPPLKTQDFVYLEGTRVLVAAPGSDYPDTQLIPWTDITEYTNEPYCEKLQRLGIID